MNIDDRPTNLSLTVGK